MFYVIIDWGKYHSMDPGPIAWIASEDEDREIWNIRTNAAPLDELQLINEDMEIFPCPTKWGADKIVMAANTKAACDWTPNQNQKGQGENSILSARCKRIIDRARRLPKAVVVLTYIDDTADNRLKDDFKFTKIEIFDLSNLEEALKKAFSITNADYCMSNGKSTACCFGKEEVSNRVVIAWDYLRAYINGLSGHTLSFSGYEKREVGFCDYDDDDDEDEWGEYRYDMGPELFAQVCFQYIK